MKWRELLSSAFLGDREYNGIRIARLYAHVIHRLTRTHCLTYTEFTLINKVTHQNGTGEEPTKSRQGADKEIVKEL